MEREKIGQRDLIAMIKSLSDEDKDFVVDFVRKKQQLQYEYKHTFSILEHYEDNNIDDYTIADKIKYKVETVNKSKHNKDSKSYTYANYICYTDSEILTAEEYKNALTELYQLSLEKIKNIDEEIISLKNKRVLEKQFIKKEFKLILRDKKINELLK